MPSCPTEIDIAVHDERWNALIKRLPEPLEGICERVIQHGAPDDFTPEILELSLVLTDDAKIQTLNHDYREKDKATNVLSFPQIDWSDEEDTALLPICNLGDIVVAYETIARESCEQNKSIENHFTHMLVHGILHLFGYDHIEQDDAEEMEALEIQLLASMGIKNPYEAPETMS